MWGVTLKIWVYRTTDQLVSNGRVREFESLEKCIETLEKETGETQYVILRPNEWQDYIPNDVKMVVEIYDWYRE